MKHFPERASCALLTECSTSGWRGYGSSTRLVCARMERNVGQPGQTGQWQKWCASALLSGLGLELHRSPDHQLCFLPGVKETQFKQAVRTFTDDVRAPYLASLRVLLEIESPEESEDESESSAIKMDLWRRLQRQAWFQTNEVCLSTALFAD